MTKNDISKVLVVDDDRSALDSLSEVLEHEGYQVYRATSGIQALEIMSSRELDLILTDLRMRDLDGMKVLEVVRSTQKDIPVIVMTGFASMETAIDAIH